MADKTCVSLVVLFMLGIVLSAPFAHADSYVSAYAPGLDDAQVPKFENLQLQGSESISLFSGAATYTYPIKIPDGVNGFAPGLTINYNHQQTHGLPSLLGYAWDINRFEIVRNIEYTRSNYADDTFELIFNGVKHKLIQQSATVYVTEIDANYKIEYFTSTNHWTVKTKDGTSYRFGYNADANLQSTTESYTVKWSLDLIEDTHGNQINYTYTENMGMVELTTISYGNTDIIFSYQSYPNQQRSFYVQGSQVTFSRVINTIDVKYNNNLVRRYSLSYTVLSPAWGEKILLQTISLKGSDGITVLSDVDFDYYDGQTGWQYSSTFNLPESIPTNIDRGYRFEDINRDGYVDFLHGYQDDNDDWDDFDDNDIWLNTGTGWQYQYYLISLSDWTNPYAYTIEYDDWEGIDRGIRFGDVNGDGFPDLVIGPHEDESGSPDELEDELPTDVYINTGTEFVEQTTFNSSYGFNAPQFVDWDEQDDPDYLIYGYDTGHRIVDFNGDGLADRLGDGSSSNRINTGTSWSTISDWQPPYDFTESDSPDSDCATHRGVNQGQFFADVNGDGLQDIIASYDHEEDNVYYNYVYINNGKNFVYDPSWTVPAIFVEDEMEDDDEICESVLGNDQGVRIADVNGDGLPDLLEGRTSTRVAYINNGRIWIAASEWTPPYSFVTGQSGPGYKQTNTRLVDANGDSLPDIFYYSSAYVNRAEKAMLLETVTTEYGGTISFDYMKSTELDNTGTDSISDLGFNLWVVETIAFDNGMFGSHQQVQTYTYDYEGGMYDYDEREFAGFSHVTETRPDNAHKEYYFHQAEPLRGREYQQDLFTSSNQLLQRTTDTYTFTSALNYDVTLAQSCTYTYGASSSNFGTKCSAFTYDSYGNIASNHETGQVGSYINGKYTYYDYAYNTNMWIMNKPYQERIYDRTGTTLLKKTYYYYDAMPYGSMGNDGDLTQTREWINSATYKQHQYSYNSYGNLIQDIDDNNHISSYQYDSSHRYVTTKTNALNRNTNYIYDLGTGNLLTETDPNGYTTTYTYDIFGRPSKVVKMYDSLTNPTVQYEYYFDGFAPETVQKKEKEISGSGNLYQTFETYDGFGKNVQKRRESATSNQQITTNTFHDNLNRVSETSYPYSVSWTTDYSVPNLGINSIEYDYDVLNRVTQITEPNGEDVTFTYYYDYTKVYNENNHYKSYYHDAFGNIVKVIEQISMFSSSQTTYSYSDINNLIQITDVGGNIFSFTYDWLGRLTTLDDPDLGIWTYTYDDEGNLLQQHDANNNIITMTYDALNRILTKLAATENVVYTYDTLTIGTLRSITKPNVTHTFWYDGRLRLSDELINISGLPFTKEYDYDAMDRIVNEEINNQKNVNSIYNAQNNLKKIIVGSAVTNEITYNPFDLPLTIPFNNGRTTQYTYDPYTLRLTDINTASLQNVEYEYDNVGNVVEIDDNANNFQLEMGYDYLNRLTTTERTGTNQFTATYVYSSIGNMINLVFNGDTYVFTYTGTPAHAPTTVQAPSLAEVCNDVHNPLWGFSCVFVNACPEISSTEVSTIEGDPVTLSVTDFDNDPLTVIYGAPLDSSGYWLPSAGDAGIYNVTVSANDSYGCTPNWNVELTVLPNNCPVITINDISLVESALINLNAQFFDQDNDIITPQYQTPFNLNGQWQTTWGDAGNYVTNVTATDGLCTTIEEVNVEVIPNSCPLIAVTNQAVFEGELVTLNALVTDPDGHAVTVTYQSPFNITGGWQTSIGDEGTYTTTITATDGGCISTATVTITVNPLPDLEITSATLLNVESLLTSDAQFEFIVSNTDVGNAAQSQWTIRDASNAVLANGMVPSLNGGQQQTISTQFPYLCNEALTFDVDAVHQVTEDDETNNVYTFTYTPCIDQSITSVKLVNPSAVPLATGIFEVVTANVGSLLINSLGWTIFDVNNNVLTTGTLPGPLLSGHSMIFYPQTQVQCDDQLTFSVTNSNYTIEDSQTNNNFAYTVICGDGGKPDLVAVSVTLPNPNLINSPTTPFQFVAKNAGTVGAVASVKVLDQLGYIRTQVLNQGFPVGVQQTFYFQIPFYCGDTLTFALDYENVVAELDEMNNQQVFTMQCEQQKRSEKREERRKSKRSERQEERRQDSTSSTDGSQQSEQEKKAEEEVAKISGMVTISKVPLEETQKKSEIIEKLPKEKDAWYKMI